MSDKDAYEHEVIKPLYELKEEQMKKKLETIDIKGKKYVTVNERLKYFREHFEGYQMDTTTVHFAPSQVVKVNEKDTKKEAEILIKATIRNKEGVSVATGFAYEKENSTFINKTSFVENCETSAWGRALACLGIGVDDSVASADEVANAIKNQ